MITTEQLQTKITQLTTKVTELKKQSDIDPLTASPEEIIKNAADEQRQRENVAHLETIITRLRSQLELEVKSQKSKVDLEEVERGFQALVEQSDRVETAIANLNSELQKLREIGRATNSENMRATGRLALDDRISQNYILPTVEKLTNSIIIHTEARRILKRVTSNG